MKNIEDLLETIDSYLSLYKLFHFCTCTEIIYGCLSTEHEAQPAICGHDIGVVGPFLSNRNVFRVVIAFFNTKGEFEIVIQTQDEVEDLYHSLHRVFISGYANTEKKFSIAFIN